jgi:tRNA (guanine9-N1)-methyltransferase
LAETAFDFGGCIHPNACADSPDELGELQPGKAYIIGGLVDRNQHKKLCLEKAAGQGIATARLPIGAHLKMAGSPILTVNQVCTPP